MGKTLEVGPVINGMETALKAVQAMMPTAGKLGIVANVATIGVAAIAIGRNILARVEDGKTVLASRDQEIIKKILGELQSANDELAKAIDAS